MHCANSRSGILLAGVALSALLVSANAQAGGFANRQQSVSGQGTSYAGVAAGGAPASIFWNPATMTQFSGVTMELGVAGILPDSKQTGSGTLNAAGFTQGIDNSSEAAFTPYSARSMQLGQYLWFGISTNAPFGLSTGFANPGWAGAAYGQSSTLKTYNASPSIAIKLADWISIGAGAQIQYGRANLTSFNGIVSPGNPNLFILGGGDWTFGWTAGVTLTPWVGTQIGVGYRSKLDMELDGALTGNGGFTTPGPASTTVKLPDMLTVSIRQRINAQFTALGTFEWTNWSRIGTSVVYQASGLPARSASNSVVAIPFEYTDGYFYSGGIEYIASEQWTLRGGFAFEKSPITDQVRVPRLPDNDRYWYSVGATNTVTPRLSIDLAYSFIQVKDAPINITAASGNPSFISSPAAINYAGSVSTSIHILSLGFRLQMNPPPPAVVPSKG
jgi:long-chain fatty acid transport protein